MKIGFLGAGNMGGAILRGYAQKAKEKGDELFVFGVNREKLEKTCKETGATPCYEIKELVEKSEVFLIGIKPNKFEEVMPEVAEAYTKDKVAISMAAGVSINFIENYLGKDAQIIRIMPNTPAQVSMAMISVSAKDNVSKEILTSIMDIFRSIGKAEVVPEKLIHTVIGISGSSPAYTYMYIDALIKSAVKNGMDYEQAKVFASQSVMGAAKMVMESELSPEELRINVCSPGGTTIEAVETLIDEEFEEVVADGFQAAVEKSKVMEK